MDRNPSREAPQHGRATGYGVLTFIPLGLLLPLLVIDFDLVSGGLNAILCILVVEISAVRLSLLIAVGEPRLLWLGVHLFVYPFLGIAALAQTTSGIYPLFSTYVITPQAVTSGLITVLIGVVVFEATCILTRRPIREQRTDRVVVFSQRGILVLATIGLVFIIVQLRDTGVTPFLSSREEAGEALAGVQDGTTRLYELQDKSRLVIYRAGVHIPVFIALLGVVVSIRERQWVYGRLGRPATSLLLVVLVLANLIANNPLGNSRFWFGVVVLGLLGATVPWRRANGFRALALGALGVFILALGLLDFARRSEHELGALSPRVNYLENGTYSGFQTIVNGDLYLGSHPHTNGLQLLSAILAPVPKRIWAGKRPDTGFVVDPLYNRAATLWTEFRVDFGLAGVIIGFMLLGVLVTRLESRLAHQSLAQALILPVLAGFAVYLLRGSLLPVMNSLYPLLLAYFIAIKRLRARPPTLEPLADVQTQASGLTMSTGGTSAATLARSPRKSQKK